MNSSDRHSGENCSADGAHCHHDHGPTTGAGLACAMVAVAALCLGWLCSVIGPETITKASLIATVLYWIAFFCGGLFAAIDTVKSLAQSRFTIDTLMVAAGIGAAGIGHLPEGALLLTLFSIGHAAEHYAMSRAERSIQSLAALRPTTATRIDPESQETSEVPIGEIKTGDTVLVRPDSRLPVDGVVVAGQSSVDQSSITGESIPVDKQALDGFDAARDDVSLVAKEHQVFAGTINGSGALQVQVTRANEDSTLARVVRLVAEAQSQRSPTQRLTDAFERRFVPSVLVLVAVLLLAFLVIDETFSSSLYRAMAVLVAASPCALAIATPSAVLSAVARAGREGVLIKGGGPLEQLGKVTAIAFDKTGTLTTGRPEVVEIITILGVDHNELLAKAAAVQRWSDHPLARAIVRAHDTESISLPSSDAANQVTELQRVSGQGMFAKLNGQVIAIGNERLFVDRMTTMEPIPAAIATAEAALRLKGCTTSIVSCDRQFLGVIGLVDTPRPAARQVIATLHKMGIKPQVMLSGDHSGAANAIGKQLKLDEVRGDLLPVDKVAAVTELATSHVIAMVGEGANDAPAMAAASVSIAMGAAGSDVALETADIALMGDDLTKLPFAIGLSQAANRIILQNLWVSLGMIAILVPATIIGLRLGPAVVMHEGSTLVVVANALRLLAYKSRKVVPAVPDL